MKKIVILIVVLLLLAGGGAAAYHFYFQNNDQVMVDEEQTEPTDETGAETQTAPKVIETSEPVNDLFVNERQISVVNQPNLQGYKVKTLYKGDEIRVRERKNGYLRISDYVVLKEGETAQAEWIKQEGLSEQKPVIDQKERNEILDGYVQNSDDFLLYQDIFRTQTETLLQEKKCVPEDFHQLGGWVRSVTFAQQPIYFVYCGGLNQADKIYLNVDSGELFQPSAD
ncbi:MULTISPECIES: hypothetical protein [unclassified Vibrio]|uniref:SH3b domain-containing protein n=1 Tax=Vibrio sp. HB236076 TaxID=3232307 RepID=A0AB39HIG0_9VIBR|nr:hypothetical protein [Vibrio sp. HB161653]MDP5253240.1 hypothetical protein [Vibrio sp. HB161653]